MERKKIKGKERKEDERKGNKTKGKGKRASNIGMCIVLMLCVLLSNTMCCSHQYLNSLKLTSALYHFDFTLFYIFHLTSTNLSYELNVRTL